MAIKFLQSIKDFFKIKLFLFSTVKFLKTYKAPLLSGVLFGCSFIPFPFFLLLFCLVPLWWFIYHQTSLKRVLIACFLCQFMSALIGFHWMIYTFHHFGGMNWFVSSLFLIAFCLVTNLYVPLSGLLWFLLTKKSPFPLPVSVKLLLFPLLFAVLHPLLPVLFPWNMGYMWLWGAGYPWFGGGLMGAHTAELWGFRFLNTLFYIFNFLFLIFYKHRWDRVGIQALSGVVALFVFVTALGFYLQQRLPKPDKFLKAIVIQNNIGFVGHLDPKPFKKAQTKAYYITKSLSYKAVKRYARSKPAREKIDFILWPEGAYSYTLRKGVKRDQRKLVMTAKRLGIPLITGASMQEDGRFSNALVVFDRKGQMLEPYKKVKLLIFGEYFPLIDSIPFLRKMFPYFGQSFTAGKAPQVQELEGRHLGWQICYESLFDSFSRELANKKAQVVVNVTNDSWYGSWQEPFQHLIMNFARAIEIRRPLIRATNTGYSGVIHANGTIDKVSSFNEKWFHLYKVPYYENPPKTLFMSWGYYINEIFLSLLALFICFLSFKSWFLRKS